MEFEYLKGLETFESVQNYIQTQKQVNLNFNKFRFE